MLAREIEDISRLLDKGCRDQITQDLLDLRMPLDIQGVLGLKLLLPCLRLAEHVKWQLRHISRNSVERRRAAKIEQATR